MSIRSVTFGVLSNYLSLILLFFGNFIQTAFVVRFLGKHDSGLWFLFLGVLVIVGICDFGLSPTLSREIGLASYKQDLHLRLSIIYSTVKKLVYLLSLLLLLALIIFYWTFFGANFLNSAQRLAFCIFSVAIIIRFYANPALAVIYGLGHVALKNSLITISSAINVFVGSLVLWLGGGLLGISTVYFFGYFVLLLSAIFVMKTHYKVKANQKISTIFLKRILYPCYQWTVMNLGAIFILQINTFIISFLLGVIYVAKFAVIRQICSSLLTFSGVLSVSIVPFVSINYGKNKLSEVHDYFLVAVKFSTIFSIAMAIFICFFSQSIASIWLGKHLFFQKNVLIVMLITTVFEVHHVACARVCMASGYVKFAGIAILGGALNVVLCYVLIPHMGILGAALAILIAQLITNNWYVVMISVKKLKISIHQYLKMLLDIVSYAFILCSVVALVQLPQSKSLSVLIVYFLSFLIVSVLILMIYKKERQLVFFAVKRVVALCKN